MIGFALNWFYNELHIFDIYDNIWSLIPIFLLGEEIKYLEALDHMWNLILL